MAFSAYGPNYPCYHGETYIGIPGYSDGGYYDVQGYTLEVLSSLSTISYPEYAAAYCMLGYQPSAVPWFGLAGAGFTPYSLSLELSGYYDYLNQDPPMPANSSTESWKRHQANHDTCPNLSWGEPTLGYVFVGNRPAAEDILQSTNENNQNNPPNPNADRRDQEANTMRTDPVDPSGSGAPNCDRAQLENPGADPSRNRVEVWFTSSVGKFHRLSSISNIEHICKLLGDLEAEFVDAHAREVPPPGFDNMYNPSPSPNPRRTIQKEALEEARYDNRKK